MSRSLLLSTSAASALALAAQIPKEAPDGWYGAIDAGYATIQDIEAALNSSWDRYRMTGEEIAYRLAP